MESRTKQKKTDQHDWQSTYSSIVQSINSFVGNNLTAPQNFSGIIIAKVTSISLQLLTATRFSNPRSLTIEGQQQLALGDLYHAHSKKQGAFLKDIEIPSHVSAAKTDERISHVKIKKGTRLIQYVRPGGYLGDYYAASDKTLPDELGTSALVTDPNDPTKVTNRVKIELVVMEDAIEARVSTAKPVKDFWSIKGEIIECNGGGEQYYMPLPVSEKKRCLVILAETDPLRKVDIELIAKNNGLIVLNRQAALQQLGLSDFLEAYSRIELITENDLATLDHYASQEMAYQALQKGHPQMAIIYLRHALIKRGANVNDKLTLKLVLGMLYCALGQAGLGVKCIQEFLQDSQHLPVSESLRLHAMLHLARAEEDPSQSIRALIEVQKKLVGAQYNEMQALINLDIGIRYNLIANETSDEITYDDFNEQGEQHYLKMQYAVQAEQYLNSAQKSHVLFLLEEIICHIELAFSYHKQRRYREAICLLCEVETELTELIESVRGDFHHAALLDMEMQLLGVKLGIGINLARYKSTEGIPGRLYEVNPVEYLLNIATQLDAAPPMLVKLVFHRWVGRDVNNLYIEGWFKDKAKDSSIQGARLIGLYRKYMPLDIEQICQDLRSNRVEKLSLGYLGMPEPAGISDAQFQKLMQALSVNTSLKSLFMRRFSSHVADQGIDNRAELLFTALLVAHRKGQRLEYLSYSGAKFNHVNEMHLMVDYLESNQNLRILQPSLYDWHDINAFKRLAQAISHHASLTTLLTGIFKLKDAGRLLYDAGLQCRNLRYIYAFPGSIGDINDDGVQNNEWLKRLHAEKNNINNALQRSHC